MEGRAVPPACAAWKVLSACSYQRAQAALGGAGGRSDTGDVVSAHSAGDEASYLGSGIVYVPTQVRFFTLKTRCDFSVVGPPLEVWGVTGMPPGDVVEPRRFEELLCIQGGCHSLSVKASEVARVVLRHR